MNTMICSMLISGHVEFFWKFLDEDLEDLHRVSCCSSFPANFHATFMFPADFPALACISLGF